MRPLSSLSYALLRMLFALALTLGVGPAQGQTPDGVPVVFDGRRLFGLYSPIGPYRPEERATIVLERLHRLADSAGFAPDRIAVAEAPTGSEVRSGDLALVTVTDGDAQAVGVARPRLAAEYAQTIREAVTEYRQERSGKRILLSIVYTLLATLTLILAFRLLGKIQVGVNRRLKRLRDVPLPGLKLQSSAVLAERVTEILLGLFAGVRLIGSFLLCYAYLALTLGFFPWTHGYAASLTRTVETQLEQFGRGFVAWLPDLVLIVLIVLFTRLVLKVVHFLFTEIEKGAITVSWLERDLAAPTYKIVRFLIVALSVVAVLPYIPGYRSPAFQGISVFLGVLFSLGSSSAVSNMIAGVVLTYMRPFALGDRVKIADTEGDVMERTLLVTRIKTIKNVDITIPNAMVLGTHIINYSDQANDAGLILHTGVTIGYDTPWRQVHELLIAAAKMTSLIQATPAPFVLQTALNDFYVSYQLNAFTHSPNLMAVIYSELHQNIQDQFNEAGVEIMSPHYTSLRDGNPIAIPSDYVPSDYHPPSFRVKDEGSSDE